MTRGSYEAYCLNEAVWYFGASVEAELDKAGQKRNKGDGKVIAARKRVLEKYVTGGMSEKKFADPMALFE